MIIHRYIFKEIFPPFGVSLIFFSFVFIMTQLPEVTNYIVNYNSYCFSTLRSMAGIPAMLSVKSLLKSS